MKKDQLRVYNIARENSANTFVVITDLTARVVYQKGNLFPDPRERLISSEHVNPPTDSNRAHGIGDYVYVSKGVERDAGERNDCGNIDFKTYVAAASFVSRDEFEKARAKILTQYEENKRVLDEANSTYKQTMAKAEKAAQRTRDKSIESAPEVTSLELLLKIRQ